MTKLLGMGYSGFTLPGRNPYENILRFLQVRFALQAILPWKDSLIVSEILR